MHLRKKLFMAFTALICTAAYAQQQPMKTLALEDLSSFKQQAGNWQVVGDVVMNPSVDVHQRAAAPAAETGKKKKKSSPTVGQAPQAVSFTAGKGILLNINDETKKDNIVTTFEHGDIELELEVMLPKGSNSGLFLQGRYELQLFDSWGVKDPKFSDIGGIYRNWETEPSKIYMGKAPITNAAKAPGLWQTLKVSFRAPRFDASGKKVANARFVSVELNGVKIHDNVEVPQLTGGPIANTEAPTGPLMIQGDHGPVALRNIRYKLMKEVAVSMSAVTYKTFQGNFKEVSQFATAKPVKTGTSPELTAEVLDDVNAYGVIYSGTVTVPADDTYTFNVGYTGGVVLTINDETIVEMQRPDAGGWVKGSIELKAGTYPFVIANFKDASWMPPRLGLTVQTASSYPVALHAYNSFPPDDQPTSPILIGVGSEPRLLRAFIDFKGNRGERLTHTIGVGDPSGTHYVYDLASGNVAAVWHGGFVDATPMWHDRGDGSFRPLGAAQYLFLGQPLAFLAQAGDAFPATGKEGEFRPKGYTVSDRGRPLFKYTYQGLEVEDQLYPDDNARVITHEVNIKNRGTKTGLYYKLAEGAAITTMPDGTYCVDKQYYIRTSTPAVVRERAGKKELVASVTGSNVKYSIIW